MNFNMNVSKELEELIKKHKQKGQNKISGKVLYLKTFLIEKESTVSPWRFLKIENIP